MYYLKTKKILVFFLTVLFVGSGILLAQKNETNTVEKEKPEHKNDETKSSTVQWYSFEGALKLNGELAAQGLPTKKIFVDVYTDWCGWCKQMDAKTFAHPVIIEKLNKDWIPVKLDAERKDTLIINGQEFVNQNPEKNRSSHQLAQALLQGQMSYPSYALIDETGKQIQTVKGFQTAQQFEMLLDFFSSNSYKTTEWEEYQKTYQGSIKE
jgi:thioredoxin-related protein